MDMTFHLRAYSYLGIVIHPEIRGLSSFSMACLSDAGFPSSRIGCAGVTLSARLLLPVASGSSRALSFIQSQTNRVPERSDCHANINFSN